MKQLNQKSSIHKLISLIMNLTTSFLAKVKASQTLKVNRRVTRKRVLMRTPKLIWTTSRNRRKQELARRDICRLKRTRSKSWKCSHLNVVNVLEACTKSVTKGIKSLR
jgi:hypothetical protein